MENEYIYFATNPFYKDDIVKIGWTRNEPKIRAKSLYNTSVPCEFDFEFIIKTPFGQGYNIENKIHNYLKKYRINKKREFFKINKDDLIMILTDELNLEITYKLSNNIEEIVEEKQEEIVEEKQEEIKKYNCLVCHYSTNNKYEYDKHTLTGKHQMLINCEDPNKIVKEMVCICGKKYKHQSSFSRHKKMCISIKNIKDTEDNVNITPEMVLKIIKNDNEIKNIIMEQNTRINNYIKNNVITNV